MLTLYYFNFFQFSPITCTTSDSVSGFECTLECDHGFSVYGKKTRICGMEGSWINFITGTVYSNNMKTDKLIMLLHSHCNLYYKTFHI